MGQLYINEQLIDFSSRTVIGITKQINDIGSIEKIKGDTTNSFKLPKTKNNLIALGLPGDFTFSEGKEYKKLQAKYIEDGEEIIPNGVGLIDSVDEYINLKVISGNIEFFDLIGGSVRDLDLSEYNHVWNLNTILSNNNNAEGFIYPIIDFGNLPTDNRFVNVKYLRPSLFVHSIIDKVIIKTGFKKKGEIFQDPDFLSEIIPLTDELKQPDGFDSSFYFKGLKTVNQKNKDAGSFFKVTFPDTDDSSANVGGKWDANNNRYTFLKGATVKFTGKFRVSGNNDSMQDFIIGFNKNGQFNGAFPSYFASAIVQVKYRTIADASVESDEIFFAPGDYVEVWARRYKPAASFAHQQEVREGSNITLALGAASYGSDISVQKSLPDISIKDFIKSWMYRFCLIIQTDNVSKTVTFKSFDEVQKNIPLSKDWSNKVDESFADSREFNIGSYAQNNWFRYKEDNNIPGGNGDGVIKIDDQTLEQRKDVINMPFSASLSNYRLKDVNVALIQKIDPTNTDTSGNVIPEFKLNSQPRILRIYRRNFDITDPIKYHEGDVNNFTSGFLNIPIGYFTLSGLHGLDFTDILLTRYAQLKRCLVQSKRINVRLLLNALDMAEFDHFIPVFIRKYGFYFYVNKIQDYQEGEATKVELIRL